MIWFGSGVIKKNFFFLKNRYFNNHFKGNKSKEFSPWTCRQKWLLAQSDSHPHSVTPPCLPVPPSPFSHCCSYPTLLRPILPSPAPSHVPLQLTRLGSFTGIQQGIQEGFSLLHQWAVRMPFNLVGQLALAKCLFCQGSSPIELGCRKLCWDTFLNTEKALHLLLLPDHWCYWAN